MKPVTIYTTSSCPYCRRAKALLTRKGVPFAEVDVSWDDARHAEMTAKAGGRTSVPQIWIGDRHIGGCDDLYELEYEHKLDALLQA